MSSQFTRREFLKTSATAALSAGIGGRVAAATAPRTATDQVTLGHSGVRLSRLGIGTGSNNGQVQRDMGQEAFTRLVHAAYERGVTYIDTADNYKTHGMVREAIKGLPREKLYIQTKMPWDRAPFTENPLKELDRFRSELGTDYVDSLLIHCATEAHVAGRSAEVPGCLLGGAIERAHPDQRRLVPWPARLDRRDRERLGGCAPGAYQRAGPSHGRR